MYKVGSKVTINGFIDSVYINRGDIGYIQNIQPRKVINFLGVHIRTEYWYDVK